MEGEIEISHETLSLEQIQSMILHVPYNEDLEICPLEEAVKTFTYQLGVEREDVKVGELGGVEQCVKILQWGILQEKVSPAKYFSLYAAIQELQCKDVVSLTMYTRRTPWEDTLIKHPNESQT